MKELARLFYIQLRKIDEDDSLEEAARVEAVYRLLNLLFVEVTRDERIQFTTLFARIAYACQKHLVSKQQQFYIHTFRKECRHLLAQNEQFTAKELYEFGLKVVTDTIGELFNEATPSFLGKIVPKKHKLNFSPSKVASFKPKARVVILEDDAAKEQLIGRDEAHPEVPIRIQYGIAERNENFTPSVQCIRSIFGFPVTVNLIDIEIDESGIYRPKGFVIEPDYLIDVTSIAECFKDFGAEPIFHLLKRYLPFEASKHLMLGNIANFFLDELMTNPDHTFKELFPKVFRLNPLAFTLFEDSEIREIMMKSQKHYVNLKQMVLQGLAGVNINPKDCFLEPSFYSETYGIQGRLDIFYKNPNNQTEAAIVELKSGKTFRPNKYGINHNHYTQTLLYDLIIKSTFGYKINPTNYILYSGLDERQLRYAPATKTQQMEAIQLRNHLVAIERKLGQSDASSDALLRRISVQRMPMAKGFLAKDLALFEKVYSNMSPLEKAYFVEFSAFIAREQQLAKTGVEGIERAHGLASLWLSDFVEKQDNFDLLAYLKIEKNNAKEEEPIMVFRKTEKTNPLANFRTGDIAVLYPYENQGDTVLQNQIFKCSIIAVSKDSVTVRLRSKQFNNSIFELDVFWNMEHDMMDSSFLGMYRGLFSFAQSSARKRNLLMTKSAPRQAKIKDIVCPPDLTAEQQSILRRIVSAEDYFLLWGPPGTGKTSKMLRSTVDYLFNQTDENILLLAYTNRAVDEICEAIETVPHEDIRSQYIRIGSKYSTAHKYRDQLLNEKISKIKKRTDLQGVIDKHRIFVATVASIAGRADLLKLKHFNTVIIDEASQILEPILVGLLPKFDRFVLVGDHKQLPAVVMQGKEQTAAKDALLHEVGLGDLRNALFERLYRRCQTKGWDWAYANLSHQGRMHADIMDFPNVHFYDGKLKILPAEIPYHEQQICSLDYTEVSEQEKLERFLTQHRMSFVPTQTDVHFSRKKINQFEAERVGDMVQAFQAIYTKNGKVFEPNTLGIITPFRAQIAQIRKVLSERNIDPDSITTDTVERYQGGARDIILISLCTNSASQLDAMISLSDEGVDRKLNVALTRARKHLVILGNQAILESNPIYSKLVAACACLE